MLMEYGQKSGNSCEFLSVSQSGPAHDPRFTFRVRVGEQLFPPVVANNKKLARQLSAEAAVQVLMEENPQNFFTAKHAALSEYRPILAANPMSQFQSSMADTKLTLIPVIFIALRIWSTIRFVLTLAESPAVQNPMLVILHGVGNTFQGGANCIMFVLCTQVVRSRLASALCCCRYEAGCTCCRGSDSNQQPVETPRTEELPVCLG
ncbi:UNVERIFIED_CONTAM: hypothetical protein FKN15_035697 [Acipenser sinensis]